VEALRVEVKLARELCAAAIHERGSKFSAAATARTTTTATATPVATATATKLQSEVMTTARAAVAEATASSPTTATLASLIASPLPVAGSVPPMIFTSPKDDAIGIIHSPAVAVGTQAAGVPVLPITAAIRPRYPNSIGPAQVPMSQTARPAKRFVPSYDPKKNGPKPVAVSARLQRREETDSPLNSSSRRRVAEGAFWLDDLKLNVTGRKAELEKADEDAAGEQAAYYRFQPVSAGTPRDSSGAQLKTTQLLPIFSGQGTPFRDPMPLVLCKRGELSERKAKVYV